MTSQNTNNTNNNNNSSNNNNNNGNNHALLSSSHGDLSSAVVMNQNVMMALYKFEADADPEISLKQYEHIEMLDMDPALNGWAYARRKRDGKAGYVPISYLGALQSNRPHKHVKSGNLNQSRSTSPNPNKPRFDDKNGNNNSYNARNNNYKQNKNNYAVNEEQNDANSVASSHTAHSQQQTQQSHHSNKGSSHNNNSSSNDASDARQIICSFHRDFIPDMNDLYSYFGKFGKVTNKIEIEYDQRRVPMAKIRFQSAQSVEQVCEKGNRQQIPSGNQNGNIYIRVYRSTQDYINSLQQQSRPYKSSRRGGGHQSSRRGGYQ